MSVLRVLMLFSFAAIAGCSHGSTDGTGPVLDSTPDGVAFPRVPSVAIGAGPDIERSTKASDKKPNYRLVVSFNSFGGGTDPAAAALFFRILDDEQKAVGRTLTHVTHRWGREGEYSECFALDELNASQQRLFVEAVRSGLRTDRVNLGEKINCPNEIFHSGRDK